MRLPLRDHEPARADRRRDRHRQDQDAAADHRAALRAGRAGVRRRRQGRPVRPRRAGRGGRAGGEADGRARAPVRPAGFPVEFLSLGGIGPGVPVRATVSDFGPQLLAKVLGANETQESSLGLVFHYADTKGLPLLDLSDLRALLTYLDSKDGKAELEGIGGLSRATVGVLLRSLVGLETGGGTEFFGEPQLDIADLMRVAPDGRGVDLVPRAARRAGPARAVLDRDDVARRRAVRAAPGGRRPRQAQARLLPRRGAPAVRRRDRRVRGVRHAHGAADPLQGRRRVLRHPGADRPAGVACSASSAAASSTRCARSRPKDAKDLRAVVSTYPTSEFYDVGELLTSMGTGEAAVTLLSEKGVPTPVVHTRMLAPASKMAPTADVDAPAKASPLYAKYGTRVDAQSARELLAGRLEAAAEPAPAPRRTSRSSTSRRRSSRRRRGARRRRSGRDRRLPQLAPGQGDAARGHPRRVRDASEAVSLRRTSTAAG